MVPVACATDFSQEKTMKLSQTLGLAILALAIPAAYASTPAPASKPAHEAKTESAKTGKLAEQGKPAKHLAKKAKASKTPAAHAEHKG
jgi:hypothetical protein